MSHRKHIAVYIMTNRKNTVLYSGVTNNLLRRVSEHKLGLIENSFTSRYRIDKLIRYENRKRMSVAIEREKQIKKWRREKKVNLIEAMNPDWNDLLPDLPVKNYL